MWLPSLKPPLDVQWAADYRLEAYRRRQKNYQWGGLSFCLRHDRWQAESLSHDLMIFKEIVLELRLVPPLGLTLDLIALFRTGGAFAPRRLDESDRVHERLLLRIQNDLLYRMVRLPAFQRTRQQLTRLSSRAPEVRPGRLIAPLSLQDQALIYLVAQFYEPVRDVLVEGYRPEPFPEFSPTAPPSWWEHPTSALEIFEEEIGREGWMTEQLHAILDQLIRLSEHELIHPSWMPILSHFEMLHNKLERVRWQQMVWSFQQLAPPRDLRMLFQLRDEGYHQIHLPSRSIIPEGGIQGLTCRGELSSLVPSELLYWEEGVASAVDIFSLRWVERELLYYEREQNISYTWQRRLQILLDLDIGEIRYKSPKMTVPGASLLFGFLSRLTVDLRELCPEEVLRIEYFLSPKEMWGGDSATYQLFLSSTSQVGGSTTMHLLDELPTFLSKQQLRAGDFRLLITTPSRWKAYQKNQPRRSYHLSLCVVPEDSMLVQMGISAEFQEENLKAPSHVEPSATSFSQPDANRGGQKSPSGGVVGKGGLLDVQPDLILSVGRCEEDLKGFARLRDAVLQSILRAPPYIEGQFTQLNKESIYE